MKTYARLALLLAVAALPALAQVTRFSATTGNVSLVSAGTTFTIQQPATNGKLVSLEGVNVYCSAACSFTQSQNGAAATSTAGTANPILPFGAAATATVWTASNVGSGTAAGGITLISGGAGSDRTVSLNPMTLGGGGGTNNNYSIVIASMTGTVNITLIWNER